MMERNNMHISIVKKDAYLRPCLLPSGFGCPLCSFKTMIYAVMERHLRNHNTNGVHFQENIICRCNLPCRVRGHFHCPFCDKTIIRKDDIEFHITDCQKKSNVVQPTLVESSPETQSCLVMSVNEDHSYFLAPSVSSETTDHCYAQTSQASPDTPTLSTDFDQTTPAATLDQPVIQEEETLPFNRVKCPHCQIILYKRNLAVHIKRKHRQHEVATSNAHLKSSSIDQNNGNQAVSEPSHSVSVPLLGQRKTWSQHHTACVMEDCHQYHPLKKRSGLSHSMYHGISCVGRCSTMAPRPMTNHHDTETSKKWWKTRLHYVNIGML